MAQCILCNQLGQLMLQNSDCRCLSCKFLKRISLYLRIYVSSFKENKICVFYYRIYIYISSMTGYTRHISTIMFRSHSELQVDITQWQLYNKHLEVHWRWFNRVAMLASTPLFRQFANIVLNFDKKLVRIMNVPLQLPNLKVSLNFYLF